MAVAVCPDCRKHHDIDQASFKLFGVDCLCLRCRLGARQIHEEQQSRDKILRQGLPMRLRRQMMAGMGPDGLHLVLCLVRCNH